MDSLTPIVLTLCGLAILVIGVVIGLFLDYILERRPLEARYNRLVKQLINLKKQGFVPQFEFDQEHEVDLSEDVTEY